MYRFDGTIRCSRSVRVLPSVQDDGSCGTLYPWATTSPLSYYLVAGCVPESNQLTSKRDQTPGGNGDSSQCEYATHEIYP